MGARGRRRAIGPLRVDRRARGVDAGGGDAVRPRRRRPAGAAPGATTRPPPFDIEGSAEGMRESGGEGGGDRRGPTSRARWRGGGGVRCGRSRFGSIGPSCGGGGPRAGSRRRICGSSLGSSPRSPRRPLCGCEGLEAGGGTGRDGRIRAFSERRPSFLVAEDRKERALGNSRVLMRNCARRRCLRREREGVRRSDVVQVLRTHPRCPPLDTEQYDKF